MKKTQIIIPTSSARHLFASEMFPGITGVDLVLPLPNKDGSWQFPDKEVYVRIPGLKNADHVVVVHSGYPDPNAGLIELIMTLTIIRKYSKNEKMKIEVIFTAMPYARQDNDYFDGELNMAKNLIEMLVNCYNVSFITIFEAHFAGKKWMEELPVRNISFSEVLMNQAAADHPGIVFISPDAGAARRSHVKGGKKKRQNSHDVEVSFAKEFRSKIRNNTVGLVDDLLSTGSTLLRAKEQCMKLGAKKSVAIVTHGVNDEGINRIRANFDDLYMSDSINRTGKIVSIRPLLYKTLVAIFGK